MRGPLYEKAEGWYRTNRWYRISREIWGQIKAGIVSGEGFDEDAVEEFMDANRDDIVDAIIYERDDSDAVSELLKTYG